MAIEIVNVPIKNGGSFHSYVNVYQRVYRILRLLGAEGDRTHEFQPSVTPQTPHWEISRDAEPSTWRKHWCYSKLLLDKSKFPRNKSNVAKVASGKLI